MPDDAEVESTVALLLVVERPVEADVDSDAVLLALAVMPEEAEVESAVAMLFVDDSPVESEPTPL